LQATNTDITIGR